MAIVPTIDSTTMRIRFATTKRPRRNLPIPFSRKRTEDLFTLSFARAFLRDVTRQPDSCVREFPLNGYGIADFVCLISPKHVSAPTSSHRLDEDGTVISFEAKMSDWRKALSQAFRYKFFSNLAVVVVPHRASLVALKYIDTFKILGVGLWSFDPRLSRVTKHYTPRLGSPLDNKAHKKALLLLRKYVRPEHAL